MRSLTLVTAGFVLASLVGCSIQGDPQEEAGAAHSPRGAVLRWQQRKSADGTIPDGALYREAVALQQRMVAQPQAGGPSNWALLGPGNIGGRVRSILIHPTSPSNMWVGSVSGGVWKSTDAGNSWSMLPDLPQVLAVTCMVFEPGNPNTIYAGTGEQAFFDSVEGSSNSATNVGAGIFKSTDGGNSWTHLASTAGAAWNSVTRLATDPTNPSLLIASTITGIYRSTNGGTSWSQRTVGETYDVDIDPNNTNNYVAGRADGRAQYSTDGGLSWSNTAVFPNATRVEVTYAKATPGTVFASVNRAGSLSVWRSINGGQNYSQQSASSVVSVLGDYTGTIWVDPTNSNIVIAGGLDLYRSTNGGTSFSKISAWASYPARSAHADQHVIVAHPSFDGSSNRTVFFGNDGGIQRATNVHTVSNTSGWTNLANGLSITQLYGCCISPTSGVVLAGAQDNGTMRGVPANGLNGWTSPLGGDGSFCAADPTDQNTFYLQYYYLNMYRSSNGGSSSGTNIKGAINEPSPNFMSYILLDPNDINRLYACGAALWRTNNAKTGSPPTWTSIKPPLPCTATAPSDPLPAHFSDNPPCNISTVAVADGNPNIIWVGHNNGEVYYTTNGLAGSPTWTKVDNNSISLPDRWVSRIVIDPSDHNKITVSFMGFARDNVWRSTNAGASWSLRTGTGSNVLPAVPVSCITQHRVALGRIYAATDLGLFYTEDDGLNWVPAVGGPTIVPMDELIWRNNKTLVVATHGRSVWTVDVDPAAVTPVGTGCGVSSAPNLVVAPPVIGAAQAYTLTNASANSPVSLMLAAGPASPTPIGPCVVQPALAGLLMFSVGSTNVSGTLLSIIPIPGNPALLGAVMTTQEFIVKIGGPLLGVGELSNGAEMTFGY